MKREVVPTAPGEESAENHVVCIDGGVERNMSQMRQLVVQLADARGHNISDLEKHSKELKTKKIVKKAALETKLNMLVVTTFTSEHLPKIEKKMNEYEKNENITQKFYQVRGPSDELELLPLSSLGLSDLKINKIYLEKSQIKDGKTCFFYSFLNNQNQRISGSIEIEIEMTDAQLTKENLRKNKFNIVDKIKEKERSFFVNSGYQRLKRTVNIMGNKRAFRSGSPDFIPESPNDLVRANNRNIGFEGKAYDPRPFDFGVHESNRAREWFIKNILKDKSQEKIKERYIEITNDLIYIKKEGNNWVEATDVDRFDSPGLIRTNVRIFSALLQYTSVGTDLYLSDFETTVWIKNNGWSEYVPDLNFKPNEDNKNEYVEVSLAAFKVAKEQSSLNAIGYEGSAGFKTVWDSLLKESFEVNQFKKAIIDGGGNPGRSLENRADSGETTGFVSAAIKSKFGSKNPDEKAIVPSSSPTPFKQEEPVFSTRPSTSQPVPVIEVGEANQTLETIKANANDLSKNLNIETIPEPKASAPNAPITSLKFKSSDPSQGSRVTFEAEVKKNSTVVYKMAPGNVGANAFTKTPEMEKAYALLVKVAFEGHFGNPETQNKQFIITVLPNLGDKRKEAFIHAIKLEAKGRNLSSGQIKLLVPGKIFGTKEMDIQEVNEGQKNRR